MPQVPLKTNSRISLRIPSEEKALLMRAAALQRVNLTDFVIRPAIEAARAVIEQAERIPFSARDSLSVLALLEHPPAPNAKLMAAACALPKPT